MSVDVGITNTYGKGVGVLPGSRLSRQSAVVASKMTINESLGAPSDRARLLHVHEITKERHTEGGNNILQSCSEVLPTHRPSGSMLRPCIVWQVRKLLVPPALPQMLFRVLVVMLSSTRPPCPGHHLLCHKLQVQKMSSSAEKSLSRSRPA
jgi:hypothetical protein